MWPFDRILGISIPTDRPLTRKEIIRIVKAKRHVLGWLHDGFGYIFLPPANGHPLGYMAVKDENGSAERKVGEFAEFYGLQALIIRDSVSGIAAIDSKLLSLGVSDEGTAANLRKHSL